jgi:hypothetical protein
MSLRTQPVKKDGYALEAAEGASQIQARLTGTFDMTATADLSLFLVSIEGELKRLQANELVINVVEVYYLGSSCIKSFVALVEGVKKQDLRPRIRIMVNPRLDWHERTFSILARLAPGAVTLERAR